MNGEGFSTATLDASGGSFRPEPQSDKATDEANRIISRWGQLDTKAINWKTHWQECYENIVPRKEDVIASHLPGDRRNSNLYDTTAILANEMLASALHGMLTNPETKFFEITFGDPTLDQDPEVKDWCQDVGDRMFRVINNTNFQTEIYEVYIDLGAAGTACLYMEESETNVVHFSARALKEIRVDENPEGLIDVVYRSFKLRPAQIIEKFGMKSCPEDVIRAADKNSQDEMPILHACEPLGMMEKKGSLYEAKKQSFKSTYVLQERKHLLSVNGYREFPYAVPRWSKTTGEIYGRGPGMSMLPDILMVNAMMLTVIQGAQKTVDPPLQVQDDGVIGVVRLTPGGLTIVRPGSEPIKPLITDARIDFGMNVVENVRNRIRAGFYVDQFQLAQGPQKTAEEVKQEVEQKLRLLGPVLGRQHFELLAPMIHRLFNIMARKNLFPPAPQKIQGKNFDVRYASMIARAQRMEEGQNISRALQILKPVAEAIPSVLDVIDADKIAREVWGVYGNKHGLLKTPQEVEKLRKKQAELQQRMAQQQQEQHQAEVAKNSAPMMAALQQGKNAPPS